VAHVDHDRGTLRGQGQGAQHPDLRPVLDRHLARFPSHDR
jgi:hypothetical protein